MDTNDRQAIEGLFQKLGTLERDIPQRDPEAERFINDQVGRNPGSPYYMAQTIVMQQMALENQQRELEAMRSQAADTRYASPQGTGSSGGGFLSRMFGGGDQSRQPAAAPMGAPGAAAGPWGGQSRYGAPQGQPGMMGQPGMQPGMMGGRGGGGFLAGAAQTAMGVAGGVLLGNAIAGMFDGNEAQAAEAAPVDEPQVEQTADEGGYFDDGGGFDEEI
ncbi:DUF2076 domain-containing protein [Aureimonas phyllosphaerae]|uniref:DUF2076 domain-containing protein n=1 Tax=Aureimonas phyllosphaerae TaxID=1166078 RepID=A0A7W6FTW8_9HYPH|nr:DUF2076 domain-containing protein [Aureimonas phyllosphaerae]MBB3935463.1 hypothetical protein [Aureimonas phyllosphaerae]MBB3959471.1 hypothetical protein [Aureimonas phyllosphaerae]SFF53537.1 hypothetical protein SAMN05216566_12353 [Aureimonas phyllosphaerae]